MGRKPTGKAPTTSFRITDAQRRKVEEYAKKKGISYGAALRELIDMGLIAAESDDGGNE
jgi:hypothetical protein